MQYLERIRDRNSGVELLVGEKKTVIKKGKKKIEVPTEYVTKKKHSSKVRRMMKKM